MAEEITITPFLEEHLDAIVDLHVRSFDPGLNYALILGKPFVRATYRFFLEDQKSFGFVAWCGGRAVGLAVGRLGYYTNSLNRYRMSAAFAAVLVRPWLVANPRMLKKAVSGLLERLRRSGAARSLEGAPSHSDGRTATQASICVDPDFTRRQIGSRLLEVFEEYCRAHDMSFLRAGIEPGNEPIRRTYTSRGFVKDEVVSNEAVLYYYLRL
ncbi:MAG: GNAT family N-acetyltransferase [Candidatus Binatia bacterium]